MACPECDHTLQSVGLLVSGGHIYWCPRCGTLRDHYTDRDDDSPPMLTQRARRLLDEIDFRTNCTGDCLKAAHTLGVTEACMLPDKRPKI